MSDLREKRRIKILILQERGIGVRQIAKRCRINVAVVKAHLADLKQEELEAKQRRRLAPERRLF